MTPNIAKLLLDPFGNAESQNVNLRCVNAELEQARVQNVYSCYYPTDQVANSAA